MAEDNDNINIEQLKTLNNSYSKIVGTVTSTVNKIAESDINARKLKTFKVVNNVVANYMSIITDTLTALSQAAPDGDIKKLLGATDIAEKEIIKEEGKEDRVEWHIKETKFAVVDGLIQLSQVFTNISKIIESIANANFGNFVMARMNMMIFNSNVSELLNVMVETLRDMSAGLNQEDIAKLMGKENTEKISEYATDKSDFFTEDGLKGQKLDSVLKSQKEKTTKEYGILDVIERLFTILSTISSFKSPPIIKTFIQLKKSDFVMKMIIDELHGLLEYSEQKGLTKERVDEFGHVFEVISNTFGDSQISIVYTLKQIGKDINPLTMRSINRALSFLYSKEGRKKASGAIPKIVDMLSSKEFSTLAKLGEDDGPLQKTTQTMRTLNDLVKSITVLGNPLIFLQLLFVRPNLWMIKRVIGALNKFLDSLEADSRKAEERKEKVTIFVESAEDIKSVIDSILDISKTATLIAIFAIPAIIGLFAGIFVVLVLSLFIKTVSTVLSWALGKKSYAIMKQQLFDLRSIMVSLLMVELAIIPIGLLAPIILAQAKNILLGILLIAAVILLIQGMIKILQRIGARPKGMMLMMLNVVAIIGSMVLIMTELLAMSWIVTLINWPGLLIGLGLFIVVLAVVVGIGLLLSLWSSVLMTAMILIIVATAAVLFIVTSLILIAGELLLFSAMDLKPLLKKDADGNYRVANNMKAVAECMIVISNEIWRAYKEGNGILKMAIVTIWLAVSMFTIGALVLVTGALWLFNKIAGSLDETEVALSVQKVMNLGHLVVDMAIGKQGNYDTEGTRQEPNSEDLGFVSQLKDVGGGLLEVLKTLLSFVNLAVIALSVAVLWGVVAMLKQIPKIAAELDEQEAVDAVNKIILCANAVHKSVLSGGNAKTAEEQKKENEGKSIWSKAGDFIKGGFNAVSGAVGNIVSSGILATALISISEVVGVAEMLKKIQDTQLDENAIVDRVNQIIRVSNIVSDNVSSSENSISTLSAVKIKQFGVYVEDSVKLMKQINKLDSDKLVKYSDMWTKMTEFMQEMKNLNIEELSDAIVNKIAPAMEGISDNVDKIGASTAKPNIAVNPANTVPNTPQPTDVTTKLPPEKPKDYSEQIERLARLLEEILETRQ